MISCGAQDIAESLRVLVEERDRKARRTAWFKLGVFATVCASTLAFYLHKIEVRLSVVETKIDQHMSSKVVAQR